MKRVDAASNEGLGPDEPANLLAAGFATQAVAWAEVASGRSGSVPDSRASRIVSRAAFAVSRATSDGHGCVALAQVCAGDGMPDLQSTRALLLASGIVGTPDAPGAMPLILDTADRLYLHKYFDYERRLARRMLHPASLNAHVTVPAPVGQRLRELFAFGASPEPDWQKIAAALALLRPITVVSGGPGTGKTTTVVNILACLLALDPRCRITLAAPTGKAAARMLAAVRSRASHFPDALRALLPSQSYTVHRLLGVTPGTGITGKFRHDAAHPLALDVLIVDEASMLDLALATKLFEAVPSTARIILLGDKDQLAAVESGAVFSELCSDPGLSQACMERLADISGTPRELIQPPPAIRPSALRDAVVWLSRSYRFGHDSAIGKLARCIVAGDAEGVVGLLASGEPAAQWIDEPGPRISDETMSTILKGYREYIDAVRAYLPAPTDPAAVFNAFERFRVLCALRNTGRGVAALNDMIAGAVRAEFGAPPTEGIDVPWYAGRPVLVLRNDAALKLYNGDIGIALPDADGQLKVFFPDADQGWRELAPARLPRHETAFAMTVHKSQGSEFDSVLLVLPAAHSRVVTRELLYTGVTRARHAVAVLGSAPTLRAAVDAPTRRLSGLLDRMVEERVAKDAEPLLHAAG
jgi:exodeoxyribonuclease V alpha subunit